MQKLNEKLRNQRIIITQYSGDIEKGNKLRFAVLMNADDARSLGAPNGAGFRQLLEERLLQEERLRGQKLCQFGYAISNRPNIYNGIFDVGFECIDPAR